MNRISKTVSIASAQLSKESTLEWAQQFDEIIFLESNKEDQAVQEKYGEIEAIMAIGAHHTLTAASHGAFDKLKRFRQNHKDFLFGYLSYDLKNDTEDLSSKNPDYLNFLNYFSFSLKK